MERKKGGAKLTRSETVTVRLDPKLRYIAELAARRQRRTLSSYIEWAIEDSLSRAVIREDFAGNQTSFLTESSSLWDVDEADRFAILALRYPELLSHEEQVLWKLVRECGYLWRGKYGGTRGTGKWEWSVDENKLIFERLRESWECFNAVAQNERPKSDLPSWPIYKPAEIEAEDEDDIPF